LGITAHALIFVCKFSTGTDGQMRSVILPSHSFQLAPHTFLLWS